MKKLFLIFMLLTPLAMAYGEREEIVVSPIYGKQKNNNDKNSSVKGVTGSGVKISFEGKAGIDDNAIMGLGMGVMYNSLNNSNLTANNTKRNGNAKFLDSIMIYQSMSGDAESGTATFTMKGGSLTGRNGDQIYVTNTHSVITLEDVTITNQDTSGRLLAVLGNDATLGWATAGVAAASVAAGALANWGFETAYNNNFLGLRDGLDTAGKWVDDAGKNVGKAVSDSVDGAKNWAKNTVGGVGRAISGGLSALNPFD